VQQKSLFDHLVGGHLNGHGHVKAQRLCGLEVEHEFEFGGLHHRQVGGLRAAEDLAGVDADLTRMSSASAKHLKKEARSDEQ
jgi:hypothetical protein